MPRRRQSTFQWDPPGRTVTLRCSLAFYPFQPPSLPHPPPLLPLPLYYIRAYITACLRGFGVGVRTYTRTARASRVRAWTPGEKENSSRVRVCLPGHSTQKSDRPEWNEISLWTNTGKVPFPPFLSCIFFFSTYRSSPTPRRPIPNPTCMENICPS